tara:strand:+ start:424 stop:1281 length:858 start_codon:yes stop_codon:yes gene_type:complete
MKLKHSKYKNTGILFELLVRQITSDTLSGKESPAKDILQKYFVKTELSKEYKLYETLFKKTGLTEGKAEIIISTLLESFKKLNRSTLKREKYNLVNEIKDHYNLEDFFKNQIPNYKIKASFYILNEVYNQNSHNNYSEVIQHKFTLLEHLTSKPISEKVKKNVINEFESYDKDVRILTYKILLEKFNEKYDGLNSDQKLTLKEFINVIDSTSTLKDFYNTKIIEIKEVLLNLNEKVTDKATQIKINEVNNLISEADKSTKINDDHLVNLLQYYSLIEELKKSNGK